MKCDDDVIVVVRFPYGLQMLELLQDKSIRDQLKDPNCINYIHRQQYYEWYNTMRPLHADK